ncbi:MAG: M20/M25/M40 family metallo-hydrolase [Candidatus Rokuibacteriota bacterium]
MANRDAINRGRLVDEFLDLVRVSSPSKREGQIAKRLRGILEGMGATVEVDDAGDKVGGDVGNMLAKFPGTAPGVAPFLLCGHMDTVVPCERVTPVVTGDVIRTDGTSVLGGDDKAGIVAILEAVRVLRETRIPHGPIDVLLTICEELGLVGAKHFDVGRLRARRGLVLDCDGVCELITRAPAANRMQFTVHGLEAHAGIAPEQGLSAIKVAGEAIAAMRLGRVDAETTANIGRIEGGLAANIIPNRVQLRAEARSLSEAGLEAQTRHMAECFERAAARHRVTVEGREHAARVEARIDRDYDALSVADAAPIVGLVARASERLGAPFRTRATGGGSDANVFAGRGVEVANLACGMREIHTVHEWVDVKDMLDTAALLVETVRLHAEEAR